MIFLWVLEGGVTHFFHIPGPCKSLTDLEKSWNFTLIKGDEASIDTHNMVLYKKVSYVMGAVTCNPKLEFQFRGDFVAIIYIHLPFQRRPYFQTSFS